MDRKTQFNITYLKICDIIAELSRAERKKVGAIIVKDDAIISYGFNGTPYGFDNTCEEEKLPYLCQIIQKVTKDIVLHAEVNAIYKIARSHTSCEHATMYCNIEPCFECCKAIIQAGIECVVYSKSYGNGAGIELLNKGKLVVYHYEHY